MHKYFCFLAVMLLSGCLHEKQDQANHKGAKVHMKIYNFYDKKNHLQPDFEKSKFDTLHSWELGWALMEPIDLAESRDEDKELSKRFSPGQKALYFFWYMEDQVVNGGFQQFYRNGYRGYLPTINAGLKLIGDDQLLALIKKVEQQYVIHEKLNNEQIEKGTWEPDSSLLTKFEQFDQEFYIIHGGTMQLIEDYARLHPDEFVKLK